MRPVTFLIISIMNVINWKLSVKVLWRLSIFPQHASVLLHRYTTLLLVNGSVFIQSWLNWVNDYTELIKLVKMNHAWMLDNIMYCHERTWIQYISITDPKKSIHDLCTGWIDDLWNMRQLNFRYLYGDFAVGVYSHFMHILCNDMRF